MRGVISKVPRETDSDLRRWRKEVGWEVEKPGWGRKKEGGKWRSLGGGGRRVRSEDAWNGREGPST